ncbi:hypothetical protein, partial [Schlesneria sp.]|uniref:hypothetical protein n=1 Tax=Schlesneria sp. TaxID=2762018 RepID=UPI002EE2D970
FFKSAPPDSPKMNDSLDTLIRDPDRRSPGRLKLRESQTKKSKADMHPVTDIQIVSERLLDRGSWRRHVVEGLFRRGQRKRLVFARGV